MIRLGHTKLHNIKTNSITFYYITLKHVKLDNIKISQGNNCTKTVYIYYTTINLII